MTEETNSLNLLSSLLQQEERCYEKGKLKLIEIENCIKDCRNNVQKSTTSIREAIHSASNQLDKLELNLCLELVDENQKQETTLKKAKDDLSYAMASVSKYSSDAKLNLLELDAADKENESVSIVKKLLPNIREIIKDFNVDPIKFIPMPLTVDNHDVHNLSIGYIQKYGIDVNMFQLNANIDFIVDSSASVSVKCETKFDFTKYEDILSWDVECQGKTIITKSVTRKDEFIVTFIVEQESVYRISFKVLNQHVPGSPLYKSPQTTTEVCHQNGLSLKRKVTSPSLNAGSDSLPGNQFTEDITSLVDDLPLFAQEFGDSCSVALIQFFSKNLSLQSNSEPRNKKSCAKYKTPTKLVNRSKIINDVNHQPLRKPKTAIQTQEKSSPPVTPIENVIVKAELESPTPVEVVEVKPEISTLHQRVDRKEVVKYKNGHFGEAIVRNSENLSTELPDLPSHVESSTVKKIIQAKPPKSFRKNWNENYATNDKNIEQEQKDITQFNQLLEKRLAAKVAFCVRSTDEFGFRCPIGVAELKSLQIIVADTFNHRLLLFTSEGEFIELLKTEQVRMNHPSAIAVLPNGKFAVRDDVAVHMFSPSAKYMHPIGKSFLGKHFGLAVNESGHLLTVEILDDQLTVAVIDPDKMILVRRICIFESDGVNRLKSSMPRFISYRPPNDLLVVDLGKDVIYIVDLSTGKIRKKFGKSGTGEGEFNDPSGIVCDAEGYIIVGDSRNHRIQVFTPDGEFVTVLRVNRPLRRPSGIFLTPSGGLFVLNYWEQSLVKYKLYVSRD